MVVWENDNRNLFWPGGTGCGKLKAVLAEDQEIECIPIAEGKEMVFGDLEIRAKQRRDNLKGKEIELTTREFDV